MFKNNSVFLEDQTKWTDSGSRTDLFNLDFQKAFDKVLHQRLGIWDKMASWIENCLLGQKTENVIEGYVSDWQQTLSGAPQASVLGSLLFLVYTNDLDNNITSNILALADDIKLFKKVSSYDSTRNLQDDLDKLVSQSEKQQMVLNTDKYKCLYLCHENASLTQKMSNTEIGTTKRVKDLGV